MSEEDGIHIELCRRELLSFQIKYTEAWKSRRREMGLASEDRPNLSPVCAVEGEMWAILLTA
ncbi:unnamed protein product [Brassica oleracea]